MKRNPRQITLTLPPSLAIRLQIAHAKTGLAIDTLIIDILCDAFGSDSAALLEFDSAISKLRVALNN